MNRTSETRIRTPPAETPSSALSPNQRRLLEGMRRLGFGTIRGLHVRGGQPIFDPPPEVLGIHRTTAPAATQRKDPEAFVLCGEQRALIQHLSRLGDGVVELVKVHDGLPVQLEIPETI